MKILLASSEVFPFSKTGGLADMVGALGKALSERGHHVGIVTPLYRGIAEKFPALQPFDFRMDLPLGHHWIQARVRKLVTAAGVTVYFIDQPGFYDRAALYQEDGLDYLDNAQRFIFLSKCVAMLARYLDWQPEIVHAHDWQVGLVPLLIKHQQRAEGWANIPASCLTIHNLAYQGVFPAIEYNHTNLPPEYFNPDGVEFYGMLNCLKAGLVYADMLTTVSPRYAREITTQALGCGLDGILRNRADSLAGILNGVDYSEWNTEKNPFLAQPYNYIDLSGKAAQKAELQREMGLPVSAEIPLFGTVSRLADQKGVDIQISSLQEMLAGNMQFVLLGSGGPEYERGFKQLAQRYPSKVAVKIGYDHALAHRFEAGCDFFLMPSLFEPCGLNQMYSLRYGSIPIVRVTGGLDDSVTDINEDLEAADGIKFFEYSSRALSKAIRKAMALFQDKELLRHFRVNGMKVDFSWSNTCAEYEQVYAKALEKAGRKSG
jgi:starch synthase